MTIPGSCHCGAVTIRVPGPPEWVASCNCSLCRRTGALMAYYPDDGSVSVSGETRAYVQGDGLIALLHCPTCASHTHWEPTGERFGRIGVNARVLDGFAVTADGPTFDGRPLELRFMDNAGI